MKNRELCQQWREHRGVVRRDEGEKVEVQCRRFSNEISDINRRLTQDRRGKPVGRRDKDLKWNNNGKYKPFLFAFL